MWSRLWSLWLHNHHLEKPAWRVKWAEPAEAAADTRAGARDPEVSGGRTWWALCQAVQVARDQHSFAWSHFKSRFIWSVERLEPVLVCCLLPGTRPTWTGRRLLVRFITVVMNPIFKQERRYWIEHQWCVTENQTLWLLIAQINALHLYCSIVVTY